MGLKQGYKQSEVGLVPEEWDVPSIESIIYEISMGPFGSDITVSNFVSTGVPVLNGANVVHEKLIDAFENFVTPAKARSLKKAVAHRGDIVVTHRGTIGQIAYIPDDSEYEQYVISQSQFRVRFSSNILPAWVARYFHSDSGSKKLLEGKGHTGVPAIAQPTTTFRKLYLPVPPLHEQQAIAESLSDADALIESLESLIAKKRAIKQGAMQELLSGRRRLPGFKGSWQNKPIGEVCEVVNGLTYSPNDVRGSGTLVLRSSNIQDDMLSFEDNVFVQMDVPPKTLVKRDDILICVRNGSRELIGKCAKIDERCEGMALGAFMAVLRTPLHSFILQQFRSDAMKRQITEHLGATINQITNKSLKSFLVSVPPSDEEAMAVAGVLSNMDAELAVLGARFVKVCQIKQGMMQELLTGRVRLL